MNESGPANILDETEMNIPTGLSNIEENENVRKQIIKITSLLALMALLLMH